MTVTAEDWVRRIEEVLDKLTYLKKNTGKTQTNSVRISKMKKLEPFYGGQEKCANNNLK
ncbi:hypothetical protein [uncultured Phocaeicola sp.]|uniref:hypothetical protein n=1 Tax=uncultured Phocaeicola sp. TaxID=990718 RepID=UPI001434D62A|nr:hypothetical protein [uncultured Phocaeicola sp.]GFI00602.1 hypothetical protein IMSAGC004_03010 [Bacteroidaceae bacterium]